MGRLKNCTDYNITRTSYDFNISAVFSGAKHCEKMIDHFLQMLYIFFASTGIYLVWVLVSIDLAYVCEKTRPTATINTSSLNVPNASPENSVDITSRHLGTDVSSNAPNHYTWHNQHISPLQEFHQWLTSQTKR